MIGGDYLREDAGERFSELFKKCSKTGRPLGDKQFVSEIENVLKRKITK